MIGLFEIIGIACVAAILLAIGVAVAFDKGILGLSQERIDKLQAKVDALQVRLEEKLRKKAKPGTPTTSPEARIAKSKSLLDAGAITQAQHDAAVTEILKAG